MGLETQMLLGMKVAAAALQGCALEQVAHPAVKLRLGTVRSVVHQLAALYPGTQLADGRHTWFAFCEPAVAVCAKTHPQEYGRGLQGPNCRIAARGDEEHAEGRRATLSPSSVKRRPCPRSDCLRLTE